MPLYDFRCAYNHVFERMVKLADFEELQLCACGATASRVISAPMFTVDQTFYRCPITDEVISSKHAHENNLKKHSCRVLETGDKEAAERFRADEERRFENRVDATIEKDYEAMPGEKREKLANELLGGIDVTLARESPTHVN